MYLPLSKWDSILNEKKRKGYKEITTLKQDAGSKMAIGIDDTEVKDIVRILLDKSKNAVSENYLVSCDSVSQKQIDEAQNILNGILEYRTRRIEVEDLNKMFLNLYTVLPRKMKKVQDNLLTRFDNIRLKSMIAHEQDLLDAMATQVQQLNTDGQDANILERNGLTIEKISKKEEKMILDKLGNNKYQYIRAFKVTNNTTQANFDKVLNDATNKETELFWHGSRTENWWSIISNGLAIRPSNAVYTGSMFGDALYFADKAQKSIGYTSLSSSYWANGSDKKAYLALFEVHTGNQKHYYSHTSSCYDLNYNKIKRNGFDSVYAHAGSDLRNNEYMVYRKEQCTIKYIVEIGK